MRLAAKKNKRFGRDSRKRPPQRCASACSDETFVVPSGNASFLGRLAVRRLGTVDAKVFEAELSRALLSLNPAGVFKSGFRGTP
jgi:hypothetical protein